MAIFMSGPTYTIGQLSRLSGISVRRIRFYSDRGLLPPKARSGTGYRLYSPADLARLELIRALRDAGVGLETIRRVVSRRLALADVLQMRLQTIEEEIASRRRISAVLRAVLRAPHPTEADLRRLWPTVTLSNARLVSRIETFVEKVTVGFRVNRVWKAKMLDPAIPELPDEPTPEQIDAWTELMQMFTDKALISQFRGEMKTVWNDKIELAEYGAVSTRILTKVRIAIRSGIEPSGAAAFVIAQEWIESLAKVMNHASDEAFVGWALVRNAHVLRFRRLVAILRGDPGKTSDFQEWLWLNEALERWSGELRNRPH